ncbi:MAG: LysR family transcriptional regulator [Oligoflexus sp.]
MTLDQYLVLVTIVESGSFRAAAERLHRAQSAVSYSIKTFEDQAGITIFDRSHYRPNLTPQGQEIYHRAKALLSQADQLQQFCQHLGKGLEPEIRLSISFICPMTPLIPILQGFARDFAETNLKLAVTHMDQPICDLLAGETDLAISDLFEWDERLHVISWLNVRLVPVAAPIYPLAQLKEELSESQLQQYTQIIVSTTPKPEDGRSAALIRGGKRWTVTQFPTKIEMLKASLGWGFMPEHLIGDELAKGNLVVLPFLEPLIREFFICRRKSHSLGPAGSYIWQQLQKKRDTSSNSLS